MAYAFRSEQDRIVQIIVSLGAISKRLSRVKDERYIQVELR
jgi:hypothetical protein